MKCLRSCSVTQSVVFAFTIKHKVTLQLCVITLFWRRLYYDHFQTIDINKQMTYTNTVDELLLLSLWDIRASCITHIVVMFNNPCHLCREHGSVLTTWGSFAIVYLQKHFPVLPQFLKLGAFRGPTSTFPLFLVYYRHRGGVYNYSPCVWQALSSPLLIINTKL